MNTILKGFHQELKFNFKTTSPGQIPNTPEPDPQPADISISENIQIVNFHKPPLQGENYSIHAQNPLLQDRELRFVHKYYSLTQN